MSRLESIKAQLGDVLASASVREKTLNADLEELHVLALTAVQKNVTVIAAIVEQQASKKKLASELHMDMQRVADKATRLSQRVRVLDTTLTNLRTAKSFIAGLDELSAADERIRAAISSGDTDSAASVVKSVRRFEKAGFMAALDKHVLGRYRQYEQDLFGVLRKELLEATASNDDARVQSLTATLFEVGLETESINSYFDYVRGRFSERCLAHASVNAGASDTPVHVEAVTNIFLEVADVIQKQQRFIESSFGTDKFAQFLSHIEYEANALAVRVIRALMKATSAAAADVASLDFCLEELVTVVLRCKRFGDYMHSLSDAPPVVAPGSLQQVLEEVSGAYVAGELSLMTSLFERAILDDTVDTDDTSTAWSSVVDDAFYIFKKSFDRSLLTADSNCACAVVNNIANLVQTDLKTFLEDSFENSKRLFNYYVGPSMRGDVSLAPLFKLREDEGTGGVTRIIRSGDSLPHALGNIGITAAYVARFKADCLESYDRSLKKSDRRAMFQQCLATLDSVAGEFNDLHTNCLKYLLQQVRTVFISPFVSAIDTVDFDVSEQGFSEMQVNDPFMRAFVASLDVLVRWIHQVCAPDTAKPFLSMLCDYIALRLERSLFQARGKFSILGATQMYQDVARMVSFFAQSTEVPVKTKFGRLQELCSLLCMESLAEYKQLYSDGLPYKLSAKDVRAILGLRSEFSHDAIAASIL